MRITKGRGDAIDHFLCVYVLENAIVCEDAVVHVATKKQKKREKQQQYKKKFSTWQTQGRLTVRIQQGKVIQ